MTRTRALAVVACVMAVALGRGSAAQAASSEPGPADQSAESVLSLVVRGSRSVSYEGTQLVTIVGQRGTESRLIHVIRGDNDHLVIEPTPGQGAGTATGGWTLVQSGQNRSVVAGSGESISGTQAGFEADIEPDGNVRRMLGKYRVVMEGADRVLDRSAWMLRIERAEDRRLVERWTVDAQTGLLLRRRSYDLTGRVERSVAFTEVREPFDPAEETLRPSLATGTPASEKAFSQPELTKLARQLGVPTSLPDGFELRSGTRFPADRADVVQLVYSDGLQEVSLFDQPGRLSTGSLPSSARKVELDHVTGYAWAGFPRGTAWQAGPHTYTLVGAAPTDELEEIANALPQAPLRRSLTQRLAQLAGWVRNLL